MVVIDGVTIGHPCCSVHNCHIPLRSQRDRFCPQHQGLNKQCAIKGCTLPAAKGSKVCDLPLHAAVEKHHLARGTAMFKLQGRLQRSRMAGAGDVNLEVIEEGGDPLDEEEFEVDEHGRIVEKEDTGPDDCPDKDMAAPKTQKLILQVGRGRTHNEQIIVCPCGIITARVTFYGAEAVTSVAVCRSLMIHHCF